MSNHAFATTAVMLAGTRYMSKMQEIFKRANDAGETDFNTVLTVTYLRGLYDMSLLCARANDSKGMKASIEEIDAKVMEYESGAYERGDGETTEDIREP